jgi:hypothetical protein
MNHNGQVITANVLLFSRSEVLMPPLCNNSVGKLSNAELYSRILPPRDGWSEIDWVRTYIREIGEASDQPELQAKIIEEYRRIEIAIRTEKMAEEEEDFAASRAYVS